MKPLLIAIAVLTLSSATRAKPTSGELKTGCEEAVKIQDHQSGDAALGARCLGFMEGYTSTIDVGVNVYILADGSVYAITLQDGATVAQLIRVYLKWIGNHPEQENKSAARSLGLALIESGLATSEMVGKFQPASTK